MHLLSFERALQSKSVLVTGHTGFTGGWLVLWLHRIGARVSGLAKAPVGTPNLFEAAGIQQFVDSHIVDITDAAAVRSAVEKIQPEVIIHLAAQPIVSRAYVDPAETFAANVMGTLHVLEAARKVPSVKSAVCITTDKVYKDRDWDWGYREVDELGGADPYSASKACSELVAATYRQALAVGEGAMRIITARGGNIIGGGDWALDRIVPDFARAVGTGDPLVLRRPEAVRPWQHVVALVHGYITLAGKSIAGESLEPNYNLGPTESDVHSVRALVEAMSDIWQRPNIEYMKSDFHETRFLRLDSSLARQRLDWNPPIGFRETVEMTAGWYRDFAADPSRAAELTLAQIDAYRAKLSDVTAHG